MCFEALAGEGPKVCVHFQLRHVSFDGNLYNQKQKKGCKERGEQEWVETLTNAMAEKMRGSHERKVALDVFRVVAADDVREVAVEPEPREDARDDRGAAAADDWHRCSRGAGGGGKRPGARLLVAVQRGAELS